MDPNDRDYTNGEITVHWRPSMCIHSTNCYRELTEVFNPRNRPWINMKGASTERIIEVVKKCPTQALTYDWNNGTKVSDKPGDGAVRLSEKEELEEFKNKPAEVRIIKNGPLVVKGDFKIIDTDSKELQSMIMTSFCRCGQSYNMPFCDGSHRGVRSKD